MDIGSHKAVFRPSLADIGAHASPNDVRSRLSPRKGYLGRSMLQPFRTRASLMSLIRDKFLRSADFVFHVVRIFVGAPKTRHCINVFGRPRFGGEQANVEFHADAANPFPLGEGCLISGPREGHDVDLPLSREIQAPTERWGQPRRHGATQISPWHS